MLLALIASVVVFFLDSRLNNFSVVRSSLSSVVYPLQAISSLPGDAIDWIDDFFQDRQQLKDRNSALEIANLLNGQRLQKLENLERENLRLRELLGSSFRLRERVKVAEVLRIDLDPFSQQVVINKGSQDGVFIGQAVLDSTGVMGQVVSIGPYSSHIILLTNPSNAVPVQINRNGLRAVVTGRGMGELLQLDYLPHNADVRVGDLLVTSGLGGRFPVGYPIGTISSIKFPQGQAFADIRVTPAAQLSTSRDVLLVVPAEHVIETISSMKSGEVDNGTK